MNKAEFAAALEAFIAKTQTASDAEFARAYPNSMAPTFSFDPRGRKYVRIVKDDGCGQSVVCFVERETGAIWKADGWKRPALNFPRGNIFADANNGAPTGGYAVAR